MSFRIFSLLILFLFSGMNFISAQKKIKWISWQEAIAKAEKDHKKIFVSVYTEWCGWCKKMEKETFRDEFIVDYVNNNFYAIRFDAEYKEDIQIGDKTYKFVRKGKAGYHELAIEITKGNLRLPSVVFLDERFKVLQPLAGYIEAPQLEMIISYFAGNHFESTSWDRFSKSYSRDTFAIPVKNH